MPPGETGRRSEAGLNICLITYPLLELGEGREPDIVLHQFLRVLQPLSKRLFFITGDYPRSDITSPNIQLVKTSQYSKKDHMILIRILDHVIAQMKLSYLLCKLSKKLDIVVFIGTTILLMPMLVARLLNKKSVYIEIGSITEGAGELYRGAAYGSTLSRLIPLLESAHYRLSNLVVVYSPGYTTPLLRRYREKVSVASRHYLDFDKFRPQKRLKDRGNVIGYIGRLDADKGVMNFAAAIPRILSEVDGLAVLIGGDGQLRGTLEEFARREGLGDRVRFTGWIPHDEVSKHLNDLRLCVLPSVAEGLPNIMLEAMACGTPFLATPSGGVPDVIRDGETGFIMEDNSSESIAKNVLRALSHPDLERIASNAHALVRKEYTYEAAVERYRRVLRTLVSSERG